LFPSVLKSWHPSFLNIMHASVWQRRSVYHSTIIPEPCAKQVTLHGHSFLQGRPAQCLHLSLEVTAGEGTSAVCLHPLRTLCPEELSVLVSRARARAPTALEMCLATDLWLCHLLRAVLFYLLPQNWKCLQNKI
jgi:hypothetical protein